VTAVTDRDSRLDPDELAALEEERDFLLRSLRDLEAEHDAGDIDDVDYQALEDDYTARAAAVLRAIDARRAEFATRPAPRARRATVVAVVGIAVLAVLAGVLVARASGTRSSGESATGDVRLSTRDRLVEADQLAVEGDAVGAIELYDEVLAVVPDDPDALAGKASLLLQAGTQSGDEAVTARGVDLLRQALAAHPEHHRALFEYGTYLLVVEGDTVEGARQFELLLAADPPPELAQPAQAILDDIAASGDGLPGT